MERRESTKNANDEGRNETARTPRSREEDGSSSQTVGERENPENQNQKEGKRTRRSRDRKGSKVSRLSRRSSRRKGISRGGKTAEEKRKKQNLMRLSNTSNEIGKRTSRRLTRAFIHSPNKKKRTEKVPTIPKRVFKALHLLRHEKFLRVVSRYLKPRVKQ